MPTHSALFAELREKDNRKKLKHVETVESKWGPPPTLRRVNTKDIQNRDDPHDENGDVWFRITPSYESREDLLRMRERLKDWEQVKSKQISRTLFYWNKNTRTSQWEKPYATRNGSNVISLRGVQRRGIVVSDLYIDKESNDEVLDLFMEPSKGSRMCGVLLERVSTRDIELERAVSDIPDVPAVTISQLRRQVITTTMCSTLENAFRSYANRPCIGYEREKNTFSYLTYDRVYSMASSVRDALWRHGMQPGSFVRFTRARMDTQTHTNKTSSSDRNMWCEQCELATNHARYFDG